MTSKPGPNTALKDILQALIKNWGYEAVRAALEPSPVVERRPRTPSGRETEDVGAVALLETVKLPPGRRAILRSLAVQYDQGAAFPKLGDAKAFLLSHHRDAKDIRGRAQAFRRMLPILSQMSEKGLEKVISRSQHSGPAELAPISQAIRGAGEQMRGSASPRASVKAPSPRPSEARGREDAHDPQAEGRPTHGSAAEDALPSDDM